MREIIRTADMPWNQFEIDGERYEEIVPTDGWLLEDDAIYVSFKAPPARTLEAALEIGFIRKVET